MDYLTVLEVSQILKTHTNTIYKMCRDGVLPAVKIGKEWRIERQRLATFMEGGTPPQKKDEFRGLVAHAMQQRHLLGVFSDEKDIFDFELTYFMGAIENNYHLVKACWWQHPDDVRRHMANVGIPVEDLEANGSLTVMNLNKVFCDSGVAAVAEAWRKAVERALNNGFKRVIGAGSKHFDCCDTHYSLLELENALNKTFQNMPVSGVCTYLMDMNLPDVFSRLVDLLLIHDSFFIQTEDTEILSKITYANVHRIKNSSMA